MNSTVDPWVITQREKIKYQEQFKSLQPQNGIVTGAQAKGFFLQSQLPPLVLGQIWALADTDSDGKMNINEFSIACKLINLKLRNFDLPSKLPPTMIASLTAVGGTPTLTPTAGMSPIDSMKTFTGPTPVIGGTPNLPIMQQQPIMQTAIPGIQPVMGMQPQQQMPIVQPQIISGGIIPGQIMPINSAVAPNVIAGTIHPQNQIPLGAITGMPQAVPSAVQLPGMQPLLQSVGGPVVTSAQNLIETNSIKSPPTSDSTVILPAPPSSTPPQSNPPSRHMSISEKAPSIESPNSDWAIRGPIKLKYTQLFNTTDRNRSGFLSGAQARNIMVQTKLPQVTLAQIWALSDLDSDGRLGCEEFVLAMYLCDKALAGEKIPVTLPQDIIPPSFRKVASRHGSVSGSGSRQGSLPGSRHASISSQGGIIDADPAAGLPQTTFEDKRKENFDKGQAELERRRKLLMDQQRKEQEERERKEREEAEKREKARLEAEKKQQDELDRELQRQREVEQEKEEQRKRALEAKDAARKELEKQRQLEWENQKILEMQLQKQREQDKVLKCKAQNQSLTIELGTLTDKIKELSQKICDTRANVTNVKTVIDGMRSTRDTQMTEMSQLKAKIKEQNQKLLQLTQEKAKWDAKSKNIQGTDATQHEQMSAAFANKQLIINQMKDKIENIKVEVESKNNDISSNDIQVIEVKAELQDLIDKCDKLYTEYDSKRNQVLEIKNNKRNEAYNSTWDSAPEPDTWGAAETKPVEITENISTTNFVQYRAMYEFNARNEDEISFQPGDLIHVFPNEVSGEPGWLKGSINNHSGWFPEAYAEFLGTDNDPVPLTNTTESIYTAQDTYNNDNNQDYNYTKEEPTTPITTITTTTTAAAPEIETAPTESAESAEATEATETNGDVEYYIAAYPYESNEIGDLNFNAGEMIMVTKKEGDWWTGVAGDRTGLFPSNYVQKAEIGSATEMQKDAVNGSINQESLKDELPTTPITQHQEQTEELKTLEDLDTEVSQINTQNKTDQSQQGSFSRPMSRTSSMTPGMRARKGEIAQVIAPYEATSTEQLSLTRGQLIMIRKKTDSGWWEGELQAKGRRRQIGWFPASYVKVLQGGRNSGRNTPVSGSKIEMTETILDKVIALYPYKAQNDDELSFDKDDIISVLGRDEPEWWRGELNGLTGLFPSNYVGPFVTSGNV